MKKYIRNNIAYLWCKTALKMRKAGKNLCTRIQIRIDSIMIAWTHTHTWSKDKLSMPLIWIYMPPDAQLSPPSFGIFKSVCYLYFSFVFAICSSKMKTHHITRDLFMEKVLSHWDNFNSSDPFKYTIGRGRKWLSASRSMELRRKFRITKMQRSESSVIVCERIA